VDDLLEATAKFTIELDIALSFLLQAALPQLVIDRETKTHRRGRSKRSYGHCRRRTEIPEAERSAGLMQVHFCCVNGLREKHDNGRRAIPPMTGGIKCARSAARC
jgi:hypothetical protein